MAVTENSYTGNGSTTNYSFTFPYLKLSDIEVQIDATVQATSTWSLANATTVQFNTAPANNSKIKILRNTTVDNLTATFYAGSAIKSEDLNENFTQNLYVTQEIGNRYFATTGGTMTGDLSFGEDVKLTFEGATDNAHETVLTVADPTADRTITLPDTTGTVVTTGDTGTVTSTMITDGTIVNGDIANTTITGGKLVNDTITATQIAANAVTASELADDAVDRNAIVNDAVNGTKIADNSIDTEHLVDDAVTTDEIENTAITRPKLAADAVDGTKIADNSIDSEHYVDGSIDRVHLAADIVDGTKIANDSIDSEHYVNLSIDTDHLANNAVTTEKIYGNAITGDKIADDQVDQEHLADNAVRLQHINADAVDGTKIADNSIDSDHYVDGSIDRVHLAADIVDGTKIADNAIGAEHIAANAVTTSEIADAELTTLAGMQSGTASILAGGTALTSTLSELNLLDGKSIVTSVSGSSSDVQLPTAKAVNDQILAVTNALGGFVAINDKDLFPASHPDPSGNAGTVVSIGDAQGISVNSSGVGSLATRAGGSDPVIINGFPSSLRGGVGGNANPNVLADGQGLQVQTTTTTHTYDYHKLITDEAGVTAATTLVNDFNERYRVHNGEPGSGNTDGDLVWDTSADKMKVYDGTASAWKEVTSSGDFKFLVPVDAGTTTAATWDGSDTSFDLKVATNSGSAASVTSVYQLIVSLNGVIQKPNAGSWSSSGEGFYLTDSDTIRFATPPPNGSEAFIIQVGSATTPTTPADNTVSTVKIQNGAVTQEKIAKPIDLDDNEEIRFGTGNDVVLEHTGSLFQIADGGNSNPSSLFLYTASNDGIILANNRGVGNSYMATFSQPSGCALYHNTAKKFETVSGGATVTGVLTTTGNVSAGNDLEIPNDSGKIKLGTGADLQIYHDGTDNHIKCAVDNQDLIIESSKDLYLKTGDGSTGTHTVLYAADNAGVSLKYDNVTKFQTTSVGTRWNDGDKAQFGTGADCDIYHTGSHMVIENDVGNTYIYGNRTAGEVGIAVIQDGSVDLFHNGIKTFYTHSTGVTVAGPEGGDARLNLYADEADDNDDLWRLLATSAGNFHLQNCSSGSWENSIQADGDGNVELFYNNGKRFETTSSGVSVPSGYYLDIPDDSGKIRLGAGNDLEIYHSSGSSTIDATGSGNTSDLKIKSYGNTRFYVNGGSETSINTISNGGVELYYNNVEKVATVSKGITVNSGGNGEGLVQIIGANSSASTIEFGDTDDDDVAQIWYDHYSHYMGFRTSASAYMNFYTNAVQRLRINTDGSMIFRADAPSTYAWDFRNNGNNSNRYGFLMSCGTDNASGTNYPFSIDDGDGDRQATVSFSSGTVTWGTFTAYHPCILPDSDNPSDESMAYPYGTLLETTEITYTQKNGVNTERGIRYKVQKSSTANSRKVLGVYGGNLFGDGTSSTNEHQALVLGDGHILCNNSGGNIEVGDGICTSAVAGIGQKATVNPSMIIGIAQEAVTFTGSETKLVPVQYGIQQFIPWT